MRGQGPVILLGCWLVLCLPHTTAAEEFSDSNPEPAGASRDLLYSGWASGRVVERGGNRLGEAFDDSPSVPYSGLNAERGARQLAEEARAFDAENPLPRGNRRMGLRGAQHAGSRVSPASTKAGSEDVVKLSTSFRQLALSSIKRTLSPEDKKIAGVHGVVTRAENKLAQLLHHHSQQAAIAGEELGEAGVEDTAGSDVDDPPAQLSEETARFQKMTDLQRAQISSAYNEYEHVRTAATDAIDRSFQMMIMKLRQQENADGDIKMLVKNIKERAIKEASKDLIKTHWMPYRYITLPVVGAAPGSEIITDASGKLGTDAHGYGYGGGNSSNVAVATCGECQEHAHQALASEIEKHFMTAPQLRRDLVKAKEQMHEDEYTLQTITMHHMERENFVKRREKLVEKAKAAPMPTDPWKLMSSIRDLKLENARRVKRYHSLERANKRNSQLQPSYHRQEQGSKSTTNLLFEMGEAGQPGIKPETGEKKLVDEIKQKEKEESQISKLLSEKSKVQAMSKQQQAVVNMLKSPEVSEKKLAKLEQEKEQFEIDDAKLRKAKAEAEKRLTEYTKQAQADDQVAMQSGSANEKLEKEKDKQAKLSKVIHHVKSQHALTEEHLEGVKDRIKTEQAVKVPMATVCKRWKRCAANVNLVHPPLFRDMVDSDAWHGTKGTDWGYARYVQTEPPTDSTQGTSLRTLSPDGKKVYSYQWFTSCPQSRPEDDCQHPLDQPLSTQDLQLKIKALKGTIATGQKDLWMLKSRRDDGTGWLFKQSQMLEAQIKRNERELKVIMGHYASAGVGSWEDSGSSSGINMTTLPTKTPNACQAINMNRQYPAFFGWSLLQKSSYSRWIHRVSEALRRGQSTTGVAILNLKGDGTLGNMNVPTKGAQPWKLTVTKQQVAKSGYFNGNTNVGPYVHCGVCKVTKCFSYAKDSKHAFNYWVNAKSGEICSLKEYCKDHAADPSVANHPMCATSLQGSTKAPISRVCTKRQSSQYCTSTSSAKCMYVRYCTKPKGCYSGSDGWSRPVYDCSKLIGSNGVTSDQWCQHLA